MKSRKEYPSAKAKSVILGNILGQGALLLSTPVLTRLYSSNDFGVYQVGFFIGSFLLPIATLRVEQIIPKLKSSNLVFSWTWFAYKCLVLTVLVSALCILSLNIFEQLSFLKNYKDILLISVSFVLASAVTLIDNANLLYRGEFAKLGLRNLLGGILGAGSQIIAGLWYPTALSLGVSLAIGRLLAILLTTTYRGKKRYERTLRGQEYPFWQRVFAVTTGMLTASSLQLPATIFVAGAGPNVGGQVSTAQRVAGAPSSLVAQALSQILAGIAGEYIRTSTPGLLTVVRKFASRTTLVSVFAICFLVLGLNLFHEMVFGPGWGILAQAATILSPLFMLQLVVSPLTVIFPLLDDQKVLFLFEVVRSVLISGAIIVSFALNLSYVLVLALWSLCGCMLYLVLLLLVVLRIKAYEKVG